MILFLSCSKTLQRILKKQGIEFKMGTKVTSAARTASGVEVTMETKGKTDNVECDVLLVSIGRRPYTANLGLEVCVCVCVRACVCVCMRVCVCSHYRLPLQNVGLTTDERGRVQVDSSFKTSIPRYPHTPHTFMFHTPSSHSLHLHISHSTHPHTQHHGYW